MARLIRPSLRRAVPGLILAAMLAVTTVSMAVARAGMSVHGVMVLCIDATVQSVPLGPDGTPQTAPHICVECVIGALAAPPITSWDGPEPVAGRLAAPQRPQGIDAAAPASVRVRDPPILA